jgi:hypothetical protein
MPEGYFLNDTSEKTYKCNEENYNCTEYIPNYTSLENSNYKNTRYQDLNLVIDSSEKSKEEFIDSIDDFMKDNDPDFSYIIKGKDYSAIIKPMSESGLKEQSSINIDFNYCHKKLKEIYPDYQFRVAQVIMDNNNENNLIDQIEYSIYNQFGDKMDLSVCKDTNIRIEYSLKKSSKLNIDKILYFKNKGIDLFQIKDSFFNDICFPYSD